MSRRAEDIETGKITVLRKGNVRGKGVSGEQAPMTLHFGFNAMEGVYLKAVDASGKTSAAAAFSVSRALEIADLVREAADKMKAGQKPV